MYITLKDKRCFHLTEFIVTDVIGLYSVLYVFYFVHSSAQMSLYIITLNDNHLHIVVLF